jgi:hypothetical protein
MTVPAIPRQLVSLLLVLAALLPFLLLSSRGPSASSLAIPAASSPRQPVIVELFTSEGCSSCPPADSLLKKLSEEQPFEGVEILALEEHVDYWNTQGWSDPFSSVDFSRRQEQYAVTLPDGGVYTPQMIVDGSSQFVGNRTRDSHDQIRWAAAHPKARLLLTAQPSAHLHTRIFELRLDPSIPLPSSSPLELWIALTEKNLSSNVTAGENSGELLRHAPVVRLLRKQGSFAVPLAAPVTISVDLEEKWDLANLTVIAFFCEPKSRHIQGAGSSPL